MHFKVIPHTTSVESFWVSYQQGEDVIQSAAEHGNHLALRLAERFFQFLWAFLAFWAFSWCIGHSAISVFLFGHFGHCDWRGWAGHPRFKGLLVQLGKPTTCESMYEELMAAKKSGAVRFASQTSAVTNADQIRKLLRLLEMAQAAGVYSHLKDMQLVGGNRTWAAKWTIATRLPGFCDSGDIKVVQFVVVAMWSHLFPVIWLRV